MECVNNSPIVSFSLSLSSVYPIVSQTAHSCSFLLKTKEIEQLSHIISDVDTTGFRDKVKSQVAASIEPRHFRLWKYLYLQASGIISDRASIEPRHFQTWIQGG